MNKLTGNSLKLAILSMTVLAFSQNALSIPIEGFPYQCAYGSDREPMDGHIIRLGFVGMTSNYGWSFFFPDRPDSRSLERVDIADNVGLVGQDPSLEPSEMMRARTPNGTFVVAQIFVGDPTVEPVVTCLSRGIPITSYVPAYYGTSFRWLDRDNFRNWLGTKKFKKSWQWRQRWGRSFANIRVKYNRYKKSDSYRERIRSLRDRGDGKKGRGWRTVDSSDKRDRKQVSDQDKRMPNNNNDGNRGRGWRKTDTGIKAPIIVKDQDRPGKDSNDDKRDGKKWRETMTGSDDKGPTKTLKFKDKALQERKVTDTAKPADTDDNKRRRGRKSLAEDKVN